MKNYFTLYVYTSAQKISFARLKMSGHTLTWWNAYVKHHDISGLTWSKFKKLVRKQFYPIGYEEDRWIRWQYLKQRYGQSVQEYTIEFHTQAVVLGISIEDYEVSMKYVGGLPEYIRRELKL